MVLRFPTMKAQDTFIENLSLLHDLEKHNKITPAEVFSYKDKELVIIGNKKWLMSCLSFSLYSLLLRILCYAGKSQKNQDWLFKFATQDNQDARYIASIHPETLSTILNDLAILKTNQWCGLDPIQFKTAEVHHNSGLISVCGYHGEISKQMVKKNLHWQHFKEMGLKLATT